MIATLEGHQVADVTVRTVSSSSGTFLELELADQYGGTTGAWLDRCEAELLRELLDEHLGARP